jgi:pSer/pThr/pTyr-binding forkhead associated (FHA) protein
VAAAYLEIIGGEWTRISDHIPLTADTIVIGRSPDAGVVLPDASLSRYHARLHRLNGAWYVEDYNSANGTFVNNERVTGRRRLHDGDIVQPGRVTLCFRSG